MRLGGVCCHIVDLLIKFNGIKGKQSFSVSPEIQICSKDSNAEEENVSEVQTLSPDSSKSLLHAELLLPAELLNTN